jgi:hypothetical protein
MVATVMQAQVTTSSMSGRVTDADGAVIGATVVATHVPSGTTYGTVTNMDGRYNLNGMRVGGPYSVEISYIGYSKYIVGDITLSLSENYVLNVQLVEEAIELQEVAIIARGGSSNMNSDRAGAVTNISTRVLNTLPSISRNLTDFTRLTPQANGSAIGGGTYRQNNITIDGASFNNKFGIGQSMPANGSPISLDAIEQVSVSVTPYDVRQSGFLGSSINAVTRSGDNEFRGSFYTYMNNEQYKGNKVKDETFDRSDSRFNLYGFRFGGPIIKNKLFFFLNFETEKTIVPGPSRVAATPENPYTDGSDNIARPTASDLNMISDYLRNNYGYETGPYQGYSNESPGMKFLARVDWNINDQHRLNVRYNVTKKKDPSYPSTSSSQISPPPYSTSYNRQGIYAMWYQNSGYYQEQNFSSIATELNSTFGNINNQLRFTYTDQDEPRSTDGKTFPFVDILKDNQPYVSFGTELFSYGNLRKVQTFTVSDDVTWSIGAHNVTAGLQYEYNHTKNGFQRFGTGYYAFNSWDDFVNGRPANTFSITHPNNAELAQAFPSFKFNQFTAYLQDEYSISNQLKVLGGLRLDLPTYPKLDTYNESIANLDFGGRKFNTAELPKANILFSPRVGFNYDILGDRSLVLRGGSGLFTGTIPFVWIVAQASDAGVLQTTATAQSLGSIPAFKTTMEEILGEIYPGGFNPATPAAPSAVVVMDRNLKLPQNWKSSLALDARLPWGIFGSLEGIYSKDVNSVVVENAGLKPDGFQITDYADQRKISLRQYYQRPNNAYLLKNGGENYYWSVTAKLEKTFDFGLSAMAAYTHSNAKSSRDGIGDQLGSAWYNDPTIYGSNDYTTGYSGYVIPNRIVASLSYRKEYAKHFATTISVFYEGGEQGRYSYIYSNGLNNDNGGNSLLYIPKDKSEITFENNNDYTAAQQETDFWNYIEQDKFLSKHKGEYALRNGALYPWINTVDVKILQDFFVNVAGKRNTIQVGLDIMNVGNLLNSNWGIRNYYNRNNILQVANLSDVINGAGTVKPTFHFLKNGTEVLKNTFRPNIGYSSTYYMQLSLRYIFN